jgi:HSP20 family protein
MLLRFDPFAEFDRMTRDVLPPARPASMPVDAYRVGDRFYLHLDLPGVDADSVDITVEKSTLTVRAERSWQPDENATIVMSERPQGAFSRQFFLGDGLDTERIEANYDEGVLTVTIPVAEQAKPRRITVGTTENAIAG